MRQAKQVPVLINYSVGKTRHEKKPDANDLALIEEIENTDIPYWFPTKRLPEGYNTEQPKVSHGLTHVHHFYTKRNLRVQANIWSKLSRRVKPTLTSCTILNTKMNRWPKGAAAGHYISLPLVMSTIRSHLGKSPLKNVLSNVGGIVACNSTSNMSSLANTGALPTRPSGYDLMFEPNFLWKHGCRYSPTTSQEAIINRVRKGHVRISTTDDTVSIIVGSSSLVAGCGGVSQLEE